MTFIGIRCTGDGAEIVTDSAVYYSWGTRFGERPKAATHPHLDTALAFLGAGNFTAWVRFAVDNFAWGIRDFDALIDAVPALLKQALQRAATDPTEVDQQRGGWVYFVGYSTREGQFTAYRASVDDWRPRRIDGTFVHPSPLRVRIDDEEAEDLRQILYADAEADGVDPGQIDKTLELWKAQPPLVIDDAADWVQLAETARSERSLDAFCMQVFVAGSLYITRLRRGSIRTNRLHAFNDTGDELRRLLAGTRHPVAQISPCGACDSGLAALDCCLKHELDEPCECLSGKTFRECCMVTDRDAVPDQLWTS